MRFSTTIRAPLQSPKRALERTTQVRACRADFYTAGHCPAENERHENSGFRNKQQSIPGGAPARICSRCASLPLLPQAISKMCRGRCHRNRMSTLQRSSKQGFSVVVLSKPNECHEHHSEHEWCIDCQNTSWIFVVLRFSRWARQCFQSVAAEVAEQRHRAPARPRRTQPRLCQSASRPWPFRYTQARVLSSPPPWAAQR
jgi:hypothetical protein